MSSQGQAVDAISHTGRRAEFSRHWRALTGATIGVATGVAVLPFYTNGLVIPALRDEFGWSLTELSAIQLVGSLIMILCAPIVGVLVDRRGVRGPAAFSLAALGIAYFVLSTNDSSFGRYLSVFVLLYVLGSASTAVSFTRTINERFDRSRGLALGVALCGAGVVAFAIPALLGPVLAAEWRIGYRILGAVGLVSAVAVLVLMPGRTTSTPSPAATAAPQQPIAPLLRRRLFLQLATAFLALSIAVGGMTVHLVPMLRDMGEDPPSAARTASIIGISLIIGRVAVGALVDRFFAPRVAAAVLLFAAAAFIVLALAGSAVAPLAAVGIGLALGAEVDVIGYLTARHYGMARYSRVFGIFYAIFTLGIGVSPVLMAWLRQATGGYVVALLVSSALLLLAAVLLLASPPFPSQASDHPDD
jgi:MFS family permease